MISLVVFSKDRAMQLESLLKSVKDHCTGIDHVAVIARASSQLHVDAYMQLRVTGEYDELVVDGPGNDLPLGHHLDLATVDTVHTALAVDDMIFYRPSDFAKAAATLEEHGAFVWSWRLGRNAAPMASPCLEDLAPHWLCSPFVDDPDLQYMFHTDGALYGTVDYVHMLDRWLPDWKTGPYTPNDLEAVVAGQRTQWAASVGPHVGPLNATCITWQLNRVQTKYGSPAAEVPATSVDALARAYLDGKRVENEILYAALQADSLHWNPPGARPTHVYASEEASKFWASCIR